MYHHQRARRGGLCLQLLRDGRGRNGLPRDAHEAQAQREEGGRQEDRVHREARRLLVSAGKMRLSHLHRKAQRERQEGKVVHQEQRESDSGVKICTKQLKYE